MSKRRVIAGGLLVLVACLFFVLLLHYVPFDLLSFAVWLGIGVTFLGGLCLVKPMRWLGVGRRARALAVAALGVLVAVVAISWPATVVPAEGPHQRLDDFLPRYQFAEYHEGRVEAPRERVLDAVRRVSIADMPAAVVLMRLRALAGGQPDAPPPDPGPILDMMARPGTGFLPLDVSDPTELVYGMVGRPWRNEPPPAVHTPEEFLAFDTPGQIKVAFNIRVSDEGHGVFRVSTETRTLGNDPGARRVFARYWRVIYPGSAIIRRVWLDAIMARAGSS